MVVSLTILNIKYKYYNIDRSYYKLILRYLSSIAKKSHISFILRKSLVM